MNQTTIDIFDDNQSRDFLINYLEQDYFEGKGFRYDRMGIECQHDIELIAKNGIIPIEVKNLSKKEFADDRFICEKIKLEHYRKICIENPKILFVYHVYLVNYKEIYIFKLDREYIFENKTYRKGWFWENERRIRKIEKKFLFLPKELLKFKSNI